MIKYDKEKVFLLHQLMAEANDEIVEIGLGVAAGETSRDDILNWIKQHKI